MRLCEKLYVGGFLLRALKGSLLDCSAESLKNLIIGEGQRPVPITNNSRDQFTVLLEDSIVLEHLDLIRELGFLERDKVASLVKQIYDILFNGQLGFLNFEPQNSVDYEKNDVQGFKSQNMDNVLA